jgi:hypothetical protein
MNKETPKNTQQPSLLQQPEMMEWEPDDVESMEFETLFKKSVRALADKLVLC